MRIITLYHRNKFIFKIWKAFLLSSVISSVKNHNLIWRKCFWSTGDWSPYTMPRTLWQILNLYVQWNIWETLARLFHILWLTNACRCCVSLLMWRLKSVRCRYSLIGIDGNIGLTSSSCFEKASFRHILVIFFGNSCCFYKNIWWVCKVYEITLKYATRISEIHVIIIKFLSDFHEPMISEKMHCRKRRKKTYPVCEYNDTLQESLGLRLFLLKVNRDHVTTIEN